MDVTIQAVHRKNDDKLLEEFPCYVTIKGQHNHPTDSTDLQGQLRILPSIKDMFIRYFEQGTLSLRVILKVVFFTMHKEN